MQKGDYIVYGHALGRCAGLRYGLVLDIIMGKSTDYADKNPIPKLRVIGVDDDWAHHPVSLLSKPSVLQFSKRILKITSDQLPYEVRHLLVNSGSFPDKDLKGR